MDYIVIAVATVFTAIVCWLWHRFFTDFNGRQVEQLVDRVSAKELAHTRKINRIAVVLSMISVGITVWFVIWAFYRIATVFSLI